MTLSSLRGKRKAKKLFANKNRSALEEAISKLSDLKRHGRMAKPPEVFVSEGTVVVRFKEDANKHRRPAAAKALSPARKKAAALQQHQRAMQRIIDAANLDTKNAVHTLNSESSEEAVAFYRSLAI